MRVKDKDFKVFIDQDQIKERVAQMGEQISREYADKRPVFVVVLNGAFIFAADLMREISIPSEITFVKFTSYRGTSSSGEVDELIGLETDILDRDVVVIEDIIDTGLTMSEVMGVIREFRPASLRLAALLHKPGALKTDLTIDFQGFTIENKFVVGYGLDYDGYGRKYKDIYVLDEAEPAE